MRKFLFLICILAITLSSCTVNEQLFSTQTETSINVIEKTETTKNIESSEEIETETSIESTVESTEEITTIPETETEITETSEISTTNTADEQVISAIANLDFFKAELSERYASYIEKNPDLSSEDAVIAVNIGLDNDFYTNISTVENPDAIDVLSNKFNSLGEYKPNDLVQLSEKASTRELYMRKEAAESFEKLVSDASEDGYVIRAMSCYRSYNYQENLYNNYVAADGVAEADTYSARAGHSEHQTGLVADIMGGDTNYTDFKSTKENDFITENAHKYGFIVRYPEDKEDITGYQAEAWHIRYVGVTLATKLHDENLTLDEYYAINVY